MLIAPGPAIPTLVEINGIYESTRPSLLSSKTTFCAEYQ